MIVVQTGARHNYAIPRMLEREGMLEALYTDSSAVSLLGRFAGAVPARWRPDTLDRLADRKVLGVPTQKVFSTDQVWFRTSTLRLVKATKHQIWAKRDAVMGGRSLSWGTGAADYVYSMFGTGSDFLRKAKEQGCSIAIDIFSTPVHHRIVAAEAHEFPDWAEPSELVSLAQAARLEERVNEVLGLADILTCPSEAVIEGCRAYRSFEEEKARLVPYSAGFDFGGRLNEPERGRVLFAGAARLGKGIHYLAFAAQRLHGRGRHYHFRVAGRASPSVVQRPEVKDLQFLGWLRTHALKKEYLNADVMAFPTLAEGSASVVYEAMAAGLPVITTKAAGSIITHDHDGIIVPERDPEALAKAVQSVVEDRERRDRLASAALQTASRQNEETWQKRLAAVFTMDPPEPLATRGEEPA